MSESPISAFESLFGSRQNYDAWAAKAMQNTARATRDGNTAPLFSVDCIKCGNKNLTRRLVYRRSFFTRREWLQTQCDRCERMLRIPTLDALTKSKVPHD